MAVLGTGVRCSSRAASCGVRPSALVYAGCEGECMRRQLPMQRGDPRSCWRSASCSRPAGARRRAPARSSSCGGDAERAPAPAASGSATSPETGTRTNGRILGFDPREGDYSCSGTALDTPSRSIVLTAGHCVSGAGQRRPRTDLHPRLRPRRAAVRDLRGRSRLRDAAVAPRAKTPTSTSPRCGSRRTSSARSPTWSAPAAT